MSNAKINIVDGVMGVGKSSQMIAGLNAAPNTKYIVLTPTIAEVTRYKEGMSDQFNGNRSDIVALDTSESETKTERFLDAIKDGKSVIATHALFSLLSGSDLAVISNISEYNLVIDETITLVDREYVKDADIQALVDDGYIESVNHPTITDLKYYKLLNKGEGYLDGVGQDHRNTLKAVIGKHVYSVNSHNVVFVVPPEKLTSFNSVVIMTYLYKGSETNAWLDVFGIRRVHHNMIPKGSGTTLISHSGNYSGAQFKQLLSIYSGADLNAIGTKGRASKEPLTKAWMNGKGPTHTDVKQLRNNTRTFFRRTGVDKEDMLWTCYKDHRDKLRDSRYDPKRGALVTWLEQGARGTNEYSDRHTMAFLVNVFAPVALTSFFSKHAAHFDQDNYALSRLLQWTWRSAIRRGERVQLYLPSARMRALIGRWLS